jgi:hypothetical protein
MIWKWSAKKHSAMPKRGTFCFWSRQLVFNPRTHDRAHAHSLTHTLALSLTHTHTLTLTHTHTLTLTHTHTNTLTHTHTLSLTHTHTHTHSLSLSHTQRYIYTHRIFLTFINMTVCSSFNNAFITQMKQNRMKG